MHTTRFLPAALAASVATLLLAGCGPADAPPAGAARFGDIAFEPCALKGAAGVEPVAAQCGTLEVAEDPSRPDGRRIALQLAWLPANKGSAVGTGDPVFFLAGGPGQAATEHASTVQRMLADVGQHALDGRGVFGGGLAGAAGEEEHRVAGADRAALVGRQPGQLQGDAAAVRT